MNDIVKRARRLQRGTSFETHELGRVFEHHWGRTINAGDNSLFSTLFLYFNPMTFNAPFAMAHGHKGIIVNPLLVFNTVFGLSVEDLSEAGGAFLGVKQLDYLETVYEGDTLRARSTVIDKRDSQSWPKHGVVTWLTEGFNQDDKKIISFKRTNMVVREAHR